jgi:hypothetical protein
MSAPQKPSLGLRALTVLLLLGGLAGLAGAVYELRLARRAWASLRLARAEYQTEQTQSRILVRNAETRGNQVSELKKAAENSPGGTLASAAPAGGDPTHPGWDNKAEMQRFLDAYPEVRGMIAAFAKGQFQAMFGPFLRSANLSPQQTDQLEAAVTAYWLDHLVLGPNGGFGTTARLPPAPQLQAVLGDAGAQQLQDYARALPAQRVVSEIANSNGYAGTPLSADQSTQLTQLIASNSASYQEGKDTNLRNVNWGAAAAQAQALLSPPQAALASHVFAKLQYQQSLQAARQAVQAVAGK